MPTRDELIDNLKEKEYREAFVSSQINIGLPYQIRALRGKMSQGDLAKRTGMKQPRVSAIERPGQANLNLNTLKRIAAAFDVALIVRFAAFSELIDWAENFSPDTFAVPEFTEDTNLFKGSAIAQASPKEPEARKQEAITSAFNAAVPPASANLAPVSGVFAGLKSKESMSRNILSRYSTPHNQAMEARV